ncbi:MAG: hypothetical protein P1U34_08125 [Coxiellaceae bacterium]|nr:hypothetical protein [Coxiellaceae bacterium]
MSRISSLGRGVTAARHVNEYKRKCEVSPSIFNLFDLYLSELTLATYFDGVATADLNQANVELINEYSCLMADYENTMSADDFYHNLNHYMQKDANESDTKDVLKQKLQAYVSKAVAATTSNEFTIVKVHHRTGKVLDRKLGGLRKLEHDDPSIADRTSWYRVRNKKTGESALYRVEHGTKIKFPAKSPGRCKRYPGGATAIVKQGQKVTLSELAEYKETAGIPKSTLSSGDASSLPEKLAVKCYSTTDPKKGYLAAAEQASSYYTKSGQFASVMRHHAKIFFAASWIDGIELMDLLLTIQESGDRTAVMSGVELLVVYKRLINAVVNYHRATGRAVIDIKPANMIAVLADNTKPAGPGNKPIKFALIDLDNPLNMNCSPMWLSKDDRQIAHAVHSDIRGRMRFPLETDFRSLATILAVSCSHLVNAHFTYAEKSDSLARIPNFKTFLQGVKWYSSKPTKEAVAMHDCFDILSNGVNPFVAPSDVLLKVQSEHDVVILREQLDSRIAHLQAASTPHSLLFTDVQKGQLAKLGIYRARIEGLPHYKTNAAEHMRELTEIAVALVDVAPDVADTLAQQCFYADEYAAASQAALGDTRPLSDDVEAAARLTAMGAMAGAGSG